jgi:hypothetical protein
MCDASLSTEWAVGSSILLFVGAACNIAAVRYTLAKARVATTARKEPLLDSDEDADNSPPHSQERYNATTVI